MLCGPCPRIACGLSLQHLGDEGLVLALVLVVALAGGCSPPDSEGEAPLAVVDGRAIDGAELEAALKRARLSGSLKERLETVTPEGRRKVLASLVDEFLFAAEARARVLVTRGPAGSPCCGRRLNERAWHDGRGRCFARG